MNTSIVRLIGATFALLFIAAACASSTGSTWTFAPVAVSDTISSSEVDVEAVTDVEAGDADPDELPAGEGDAGIEPTEPAESVAADDATTGEPRVIELEGTATLRFAQNGEVINDIPVTPGETILFRVDNAAGFPHNLYIGTDEELSIPAGTTDSGIPDWSTGVQEFEWTVPDDITGLKFGCTVPGHYSGGMQGIFSLAEGTTESTTPTEPAASEAPDEAPAESMAADTGSAGAADARVINLEATAALQFTQNGARITDIPVTPGERLVIRVDNTAGFPHNFFIGTDEQLSQSGATTDIGIPDWDSGVQFFDWVVPADVTSLKFGCTVPGHYTLMQGTYSVMS